MSATRACSLLAALLLCLATLGARCGPAATFTVLGPLPEYDVTSSYPQTFTAAGALSWNGRVVAGDGLIHVPGTTNPITLEDVPFRYRHGVLEELPNAAQRHLSVTAMTPDGRKIFLRGGSSLTGFWTWEGSSLTFTDLAPQVSVLNGIADTALDGSILLGDAAFSGITPSHPFLYEDGVVTQLVDPTGTHQLWGGTAISADGTLVTGYTRSNETYLLDTSSDSIVFLGGLDPSSPTPSLPSAMTPDGRVIVGTAGIGLLGFEPYRWKDGQMVGLGTPAGATAFIGATGVSADGNVVVGGAVYGYNVFSHEEDAFVWDPTNGMRRLSDALTAQGVDLTGWTLESANAVSALGDKILGTAIDSKGNSYAFLAELPRSLPHEAP